MIPIMILIPVLLLGCPAPGGSLAGTWNGTLSTPQGRLQVVFHLHTAGHTVTGTTDSPDQNSRGIPLRGTVTGDSMRILVESIHGTFSGKLSRDGKELQGEWKQGPAYPLTITRPDGSPASADGVWKGQINVPNHGALRIVFNLRSAGGKTTGTMDSPDQNATDIPINSVNLTGGTLRIQSEAVHGAYTGKISKDAKSATGDWWQGATLPLNLKKSR